MSDREFRQKIRTLQQQVGLLVQQVSRLENIVGDLNPGVAMPDLDGLVVSPEAQLAFERGLIDSVSDYVPPQEGGNAVEGGEAPELVDGDGKPIWEGAPEGMDRDNPDGLPAATTNDELEGDDATQAPATTSEIEGDNTPSGPVYKAVHEGFGRWVIHKDGELQDRLMGDHPKNPIPGEETSEDQNQRWFTKEGAKEMAEALASDDRLRAEQRLERAEAERAADEAA